MSRICYHIPVDQTPDPECGYRVAVVEEGVAGYSWTGDAPEGGLKEPYYWGKTLAEAQAVARDENLRLGLTEEDVCEIVNSSVRAQLHATDKRKRKRGTLH
jgi:hypothetical protein